jgi:tetratricopeptide (TPR) repeat protein
MKLRTVVLAAAIPALGLGAYGQGLYPDTEIFGSQEHVTYFSGAVALEDGSVPPDAVRLERVCKGLSRDEGWTDAKGHFSFKVGRDDRGSGSGDATEAAPLAADIGKAIGFSSQLSNPITSELRDCELKVVLTGYRADRVSLSVEAVGAKNLGTIVLHPLSKVSTLTVSATTLQAPSNARKAYDKGLEASHLKKWDAAVAELTRAVRIYPKFAAAWHELGEARLGRSDLAGAVEAWRESARADPKYIKPWERLAVVADQKQDWAESERCSGTWLQLDAEDFPGAWLFNAIAKAQLGKLDQAEHSAREGLRVDKDQKIPRLSYILGLILLQEHKYGESADCFRNYLKLAPNARDADVVRQQLAEFDKLTATAQKRTP